MKYISDDILVMYLGQMVEKASTDELFEYRLHPYTKALLSAVPLPDIGELTSPIDPKPGCRFASRCPHAKDICFKENPVCEEVRPNHFVSCHRVKELNEI